MHKSVRFLIAKCFNIKEESLNKKAKNLAQKSSRCDECGTKKERK